MQKIGLGEELRQGFQGQINLLNQKRRTEKMAEKTLEQSLRNIERAMVRLRNKVGRSDLDYTIQASISSTDETTVTYAAQLTAPANGLAPVTFIEKSPEELVKKIREATKHIDYDKIEVAYHRSQIEACFRTIRGHEERISELEPKPKDEGENGAEDKEKTDSEEQPGKPE